MEITKFIKNPKIVKLPDGSDHENWIEIGAEEKEGFKCVKVSWNKSFGWLYSQGWITKENIEKAQKGEKYEMKALFSGHMLP